MVPYVVRRLLLVVPALFGISLVSFFLIHLAPGDPATAILGVLATPEMLARFREQFHLDQPAHVQYLTWLGGLLGGDLGYSVVTPVRVTELLGRQLVPTVLLTSMALAISLPIGVATGLASGVRPGRFIDSLSRLAFLAGLSMPSFWLGLLLILSFGVTLRWLPVGGYVDIAEDPIGSVRSLLLPAITLAIPMAAVTSRITRSAILEVAGSDFLRTARAKGLGNRDLRNRHLLRPALVPVVTTVGVQIGYLLGGAVVVENVFDLPGIGRLLAFSVGNRDYAVIQAVVLLGAITVITWQLAVDVIVARLDPRIALR